MLKKSIEYKKFLDGFFAFCDLIFAELLKTNDIYVIIAIDV